MTRPRYIMLYFRESEREWLEEIQRQTAVKESVFLTYQGNGEKAAHRVKVVGVATWEKPDDLGKIGWARLDLGSQKRGTLRSARA